METTYVEGPRHAVVTSDDHGAVLQIVAWLAMVTVILAAFLRLTIRFTNIRRPAADDAFVLLAMLFAVSEVIAMSVAVNHGLGRRTRLIADGMIDRILQDVYASGILYLLALAFAKSSVLLFLGRLVARPPHKKAVMAAAVVTMAWTIASVFGAAFQCDLPRPWNYLSSKCFHLGAFWYAIGTVDILIDLTCVAIPIWVVWNLQMALPRKLVVVSAFAFRLAVVGAQIVRLSMLQHHLGLRTDPLFPIAVHIATQCQVAFAVITACTPALKPFMDQAASGLIGVSLEHREGTYNISGAAADYQLQTFSRQKSISDPPPSRKARAFNFLPAKRQSQRDNAASREIETQADDDDASDKGIIRMTTDVDISYSNRNA